MLNGGGDLKRVRGPQPVVLGAQLRGAFTDGFVDWMQRDAYGIRQQLPVLAGEILQSLSQRFDQNF